MTVHYKSTEKAMPHMLKTETTGVVVTLFGVIEGEEIFSLNEQLLAEKNFSRWRYQIWDFSAIDRIEVSLDQLRSFAFQDSIAAQKNGDQRVALIIRKSTRSGLDNVFHLLEQEWGGYESKSFYDIGAARRWAEHRQD